MVQFDIKLQGEDKNSDEWCRQINKETKRMTFTVYFKPKKPEESYFVPYSTYYIDEETVFKDIIHELTEATILLIIFETFGTDFAPYNAIESINHILTEMALYDETEPITIGDIEQTFKTIRQYLTRQGYKIF
jgi:hypothetical protein